MAFKYKDYEESERLRRLAEEYNQKKAAAPKDYTFAYSGEMDRLFDSMQNRKPFSYDPNKDAFYNQYADLYKRQGKLAMKDTMGQAANLTGGYANSFAQSAGQQAYNAYMQNLNDVVPELYQLAYDKYNQQGQDLMDRYSLLAAADADAYARHRDKVSDYQSELARLASEYQTEREREYNDYLTEREYALNQYIDERDFEEQQRQFNANLYARALTAQGEEEEDEGNARYKYLRTESKKTDQLDKKNDPIFKDYVYFETPDGKTIQLEKGLNPYTRTRNKDGDVKGVDGKAYGYMENGYQPKAVVYEKDVFGFTKKTAAKLSKTDHQQEVEGGWQNIWESTNPYTKKKNYWIWNGAENRYDDVTDDYLKYYGK